MINWKIGLITALFASFLKRVFYLYWIRRDLYVKGKKYLMTDVCQHHRGILEGFNFCREAEHHSMVWPSVGVLSDLVEDISLCGHNRCIDVWQSLLTSLPIVLAGGIAASVLYCCLRPVPRALYLPSGR